MLMQRIRLNLNIKKKKEKRQTTFGPLCSPPVSHLHPQAWEKKTNPFVPNPIFLFRTRSVNKILCHLWPLWFHPLLFPFLFSPHPSCLFLPPGGGAATVLVRSLLSPLGFFSTPGKNGKYLFFFLFQIFLDSPSSLLLLSVFSPSMPTVRSLLIVPSFSCFCVFLYKALFSPVCVTLTS